MPHMRSNKPIYQFVITLKHTEPAIYRRIEVPKSYTFWDLHIAIQDTFGWQDCHLHEFCYEDRKGNPKGTFRIGIPINDGFMDSEDMPEAGWRMKIEDLFCDLGDKMLYLYDFGDHWAHSVVLEGMILGEKKIKYPCCTEGAYLAPPEDCGGIHGFYQMLDVLKNPKDPEYKEMVQWVNATTGRKRYIPDSFDPQTIKFTNPQKRLREILEDDV